MLLTGMKSVLKTLRMARGNGFNKLWPENGGDPFARRLLDADTPERKRGADSPGGTS
jgi:hypothetical protein